MAVVWRARDLRLGRQVAVKLLRPEFAEDPDFVRRFEVEARNAASLSNPNVATVYDTDVDGERRFIVMELVDGPTVADVIRQRGRLEPAVAVGIAAAAARALSVAHRRGLVHRDVKPANLLIGRDGRVRLADFGIARALTASRITAPGTVLGSVPYLSPEQARGDDASAAGDIFSLGVVLYEMLTGHLPWDSDTPAGMATMRLHTVPPPPSELVRDLSPGLDAIVRRALEVDPGKRYPSARMLADALEQWNRGNRAALGVRQRVRDATTALAASVAASGGTGLARGTAGANPTTAPRRTRERTVARGRARPNLAIAEATGAAAAGAGAAAGRSAAAAAPRLSRGGTAIQGRRPGSGDQAEPAAVERTGPERFEGAALGRARTRRDLAIAAALIIASLAMLALAFALGGGGPSSSNGPTGAASLPVIGVAPVASASATPSPSASPSPSPSPTPKPTPRPAAKPVTPTKPPAPRPATTPAAAVTNFYAAVVRHDWDTAIALWSPSMQRRYPPQEWLIDRFKRTTRIDITRLRTDFVNTASGTARVEVSLVEYRTVEPSPRTFVGYWDLVLINGRWLLNDPHF